jgi:hypothetical protein
MSALYPRGPWAAPVILDGDHDHVVRDSDGNPIARVPRQAPVGVDDAGGCAIARLIRTAPELVDCLADAAGTLAGCADMLRSMGRHSAAATVQTRHEQCLALLVKATKGGAL